jgi:hypothetical protein
MRGVDNPVIVGAERPCWLLSRLHTRVGRITSRAHSFSPWKEFNLASRWQPTGARRVIATRDMGAPAKHRQITSNTTLRDA